MADNRIARGIVLVPCLLLGATSYDPGCGGGLGLTVSEEKQQLFGGRVQRRKIVRLLRFLASDCCLPVAYPRCARQITRSQKQTSPTTLTSLIWLGSVHPFNDSAAGHAGLATDGFNAEP